MRIDAAARTRMACALLFGTALACAACAGEPAAQPGGFTPVATVGEIMDAIVVPSSEALFDAVVYSNGALVQAPATDDDWHRLRMHALAVAEAGNLLLLPPRARDAGDWAAFARAMTASAARSAEAAEARSLDRLLETGGALYDSCTACHEKYLPQ